MNNNETCCTDLLFRHDNDKERGWMGPAHAASAGGFFLLFAGAAPAATHWLLDSSNIMLLVLCTGVVVGAASLVDLDNTNSTAQGSLGFFGKALSALLRWSSLLVQSVCQARRDDGSKDPHRAFWHSFPGAAVVGGAVYGLTLVPGDVSVPGTSNDVSVGTILGFISAALMIHLCMAGLAHNRVKKIRDKPIIGELLAFMISFAITGILFALIPGGLGFQWLGMSVAIGCALHILGDAFTTEGAPLLFPLSVVIHHKFWWNTRFTGASASSDKSNQVVIWVSMFAGALGIALLIYHHS